MSFSTFEHAWSTCLNHMVTKWYTQKGSSTGAFCKKRYVHGSVHQTLHMQWFECRWAIRGNRTLHALLNISFTVHKLYACRTPPKQMCGMPDMSLVSLTSF